MNAAREYRLTKPPVDDNRKVAKSMWRLVLTLRTSHSAQETQRSLVFQTTSRVLHHRTAKQDTPRGLEGA